MNLLFISVSLLVVVTGTVLAKSVGRLQHSSAAVFQLPAPALASDSPSTAPVHPSIEEESDPFYDDDYWQVEDYEGGGGGGGAALRERGAGERVVAEEEEEGEGERLGDGDRALLEALRRRYQDDPRLSAAAAAAVAAGEAPEPSLLAFDPPALAQQRAHASVDGQAVDERLSRVRRQHPSDKSSKENQMDNPLPPEQERYPAPRPDPAPPHSPIASSPIPSSEATGDDLRPTIAIPLRTSSPVYIHASTPSAPSPAPIPSPLHQHSPPFVAASSVPSSAEAPPREHFSADGRSKLKRQSPSNSLQNSVAIASSGAEEEAAPDAGAAQRRPPELTQEHVDALFALLSDFLHSHSQVPAATYAVPAPSTTLSDQLIFDAAVTAAEAGRVLRATGDEKHFGAGIPSRKHHPVKPTAVGSPGSHRLPQRLESPPQAAAALATTGLQPGVTVKEETEVERAERRLKMIEKLIQAVQIAGHVESYLNNRARTAIKTLARVYDTDYDERRQRSRTRSNDWR